jgi:elongation factor Ts
MANITAAEVNKLRQMTGAGMMDCKKALIESDGDFEKAIDVLRKQGQKLANKRSDKAANEGIVLGKISADKKFASVVMINCETDFVAKNQEFIDFANNVSQRSVDEKVKSIDELKALKFDNNTIADSISDLIGKIGEKIELSQYDYIEAPVVFAYNHHGNRLATVMGMNKNDENSIDEVGHQINMQIAAMNPVAIDKDDVDPKIIEKEIEIGKEQALQEGKPEAIVEKIAMGKLNKFFKENTLLNQDFVRDNKKTVKQYLQEFDKDLKVTGFKRLMLGE